MINLKKMATVSDWLDYLYHLHPKEIDLGLSRISDLAERLFLRKFSCPVITVAGTNGKGSVVRFLECIYLAAGYQVATYTSPHLICFNERLRMNGKEVADEALLEAFSVIEKNRGELALTFFEFTTLAALWICQKQALDLLILEVGLGGRLDAVNIVDADVAVITSIDIDHVDWLGPDRESIGREKAGILRSGKPLVCGDASPPDSIRHQVQQQGSPYFQFETDYAINHFDDGWEWCGPDRRYSRLPLTHLKLQNAATAIMVIELLQTVLPITPFAILTGLSRAQLPGRFEMIESPVRVILDVAHNPQATNYLAAQLREHPIKGDTLSVVGMLRDKDISGSLAPLLSFIKGWYAADLSVPRGGTAAQIIHSLATQGVSCCYNFATVEDALGAAITRCGPNDQVLVFGSFYTVSLAKQFLLREVESWKPKRTNASLVD